MSTTGPSIWHDWLHKYVLKGGSIWDVSVKQSYSSWMKSVLHLRDFLKTKLTHAEIQHFATVPSKLRVHKLYDIFWPSSSVPDVHWEKLVWNKVSSPRVSFCAWLIA